METDVLASQLLASTKDAVVIADSAGRIIYWNQGAVEMFGYPAGDAVGESLDLIIPERLRSRHWEGYQNTMGTGRTSYADRVLAVPAVHQDGHRLSIEFRVSLLGDDPDRPVAIGAVIRDVTERWEQERELRTRLAELERLKT